MPVFDDQKLFEILTLGIFQTGLNWRMILKKRGFKFAGSTICYAVIQTTEMVNDHTVDCFRYNAIREMN